MIERSESVFTIEERGVEGGEHRGPAIIITACVPKKIATRKRRYDDDDDREGGGEHDDESGGRERYT